MLFNSLDFLIFFTLVVVVYFAMPHRFRWLFLLAASYYFYMCWKVEYIVLILIATTIDYIAGHFVGPGKPFRKLILAVSLGTNLGILFCFKYLNFVSGELRALFDQFNVFAGFPVYHLILPVGISFYTFQSMSYTIDVFRGQKEPEKHFGIYAVYVAFFPQLVAGPIERSTSLMPQFRIPKQFDYDRFCSGLQLMLWGFFKKLVIADRLAMYVDTVYSNPGAFKSAPLILATYFFAFQIFCDFSAYSDIAIGAARILGFDLMKNFNQPYFARSIREFWQRWHISLTTWFRDYLYIPLGGNRVVKWRWQTNIMIVFVLSGIWHGANWTFLIWGVLHGGYLLVSLWTRGLRDRVVHVTRLDRVPYLHKMLQRVFIFHIVLIAWVFFRARNLFEAIVVFKGMVSGVPSIFHINVALGKYELLIAFIALACLEFVHFLQHRYGVSNVLNRMPVALRWGCYYATILAILMFGQFNLTEFIYFQF
ncbi:MAG: MBOAT family protein [Verrucomicrobia bacterium]|nr:MBOAT family protein [Verrucomicrobiota bacterium]